MQRAVVRLGEATCDREPQPRAAMLTPGSARAIEGLEDPLELRRRYARATVDDTYDHAITEPPRTIGGPSGWACALTSTGEAAHGARPHRDGVPTGVPTRVLEHIHESPLELHRIDPDQR